MTKLISYIIIQCKNISCNKILFFEKNKNILTMQKDGSTVCSYRLRYVCVHFCLIHYLTMIMHVTIVAGPGL